MEGGREGGKEEKGKGREENEGGGEDLYDYIQFLL